MSRLATAGSRKGQPLVGSPRQPNPGGLRRELRQVGRGRMQDLPMACVTALSRRVGLTSFPRPDPQDLDGVRQVGHSPPQPRVFTFQLPRPFGLGGPHATASSLRQR